MVRWCDLERSHSDTEPRPMCMCTGVHNKCMYECACVYIIMCVCACVCVH